MKERFLKVLKWFFIALGVLFLIQILIGIGFVIGIANFARADMNIVGNTKNKLKQIQPIINYVEDYHDKEGKYPQDLEGIKLKKDLEYKYETSNDNNCYTVTINSKKDNLTKQYQHCAVNSKNSASNSESYIEFSK